jgi:hypothetical protein
MKNVMKFAAVALALLAIPATAQERKVYMSWVPQEDHGLYRPQQADHAPAGSRGQA